MLISLIPPVTCLIPAKYYSYLHNTTPILLIPASYLVIRFHTWSYLVVPVSYLLSTGYTTPSHTWSYPIIPVSYLSCQSSSLTNTANTCLIPGYTKPHLLHTWSYVFHIWSYQSHTWSYLFNAAHTWAYQITPAHTCGHTRSYQFHTVLGHVQCRDGASPCSS